MLTKKSRYKPFYKKYIRLRKNVQSREKLYNFKKSKWQIFLKLLNKFNRRLKNPPIYDHNIYFKPRFGFNYTNKYKFNLLIKQRICLFYGYLTEKFFKYTVKKSLQELKKKNYMYFENLNSFFIQRLESRIDVILYRSHFVSSVRSARQLISHGQVIVNKKTVKKNSLKVKKGDLIEIKNQAHDFIRNNIIKNSLWPVYPLYLLINFNIFQILVVTDIKYSKILYHFPFWLNVSSVVNYYLK
nr:ribosomal protein S4 [Stephanopyxis turris]